MKFIRKIASCFVLVLVLMMFSFPSSHVFAQLRTSEPALKSLAAPQSTQSTSEIEIAVLKAQLVTMQSFTDSLLTTVYWSLGTLFVVASLMVSFGWFTTFRIHEREILALRSDLAGQLASQTTAVRTDLETMVQLRLNEISISAKAQVDSTITELVKPIEDAVVALRTSVKQLQADLIKARLQSEAQYWEGRNVPSNELARYHELLKIAIEEQDMHESSICLERITKLLLGGASMFVTNRTKLLALLDQLPNEFIDAATSIREALKSTKNV